MEPVKKSIIMSQAQLGMDGFGKEDNGSIEGR